MNGPFPKSIAVGGVAAALGLFAASGLHVAWALGSSFPTSDRAALAELVVGSTPTFPSNRASAAVAGLLALAGSAVAIRSLPRPAMPAAVELAARSAVGVSAAALLLRGATGLVVESFRFGNLTAKFRRWDAALYSPLCIGLGLGAAAAWRRSR